MANNVTVSEEILRFVADFCVPSVHSEGLHGQIDALEGAVGREELAKRAARAASSPEQRAAERAKLQAELDKLSESESARPQFA